MPDEKNTVMGAGPKQRNPANVIDSICITPPYHSETLALSCEDVPLIASSHTKFFSRRYPRLQRCLRRFCALVVSRIEHHVRQPALEAGVVTELLEQLGVVGQ